MASASEGNIRSEPPLGDFWANPSISELAAAQGVGPVDLDDIRFGFDDISEEEVDAFFEAIGVTAT